MGRKMNIEKNATYWDVEHSKKIYEIMKYCTAEFRHWLWRFILRKGKIIFFKAFSSLLIYKFKNWFYNFANSDPYLCGKLKHTSYFRNRRLWLIKTIIIKKKYLQYFCKFSSFFFVIILSSAGKKKPNEAWLLLQRVWLGKKNLMFQTRCCAKRYDL